jgi:hypothetical protein
MSGVPRISIHHWVERPYADPLILGIVRVGLEVLDIGATIHALERELVHLVPHRGAEYWSDRSMRFSSRCPKKERCCSARS